MSIPPDSPLRGVASKFPQPIDQDDMAEAQKLKDNVYNFNCRVADPPLADIEYRSSSRKEDILRHVFRWDLTPCQEVFQNGFGVIRQENTPDEVYFNLNQYVHHGGRPLDSRRPATHAFISTTLNSSWYPTMTQTVEDVYRYEIYAPGGIWVAETLGDGYQYPSQDEVCFVAGIAPQYIRSAQRFRLIAESSATRRQRVNNVISVNGNCNPQSDLLHLLPIQWPVFNYVNENGVIQPLRQSIWPDSKSNIIDWYARTVANCESYINAAFRSSNGNEAYLFMKDEYVQINYAPGSTNDQVLNGPLLIRDGFPSLAGTAFAEHGIDCAFGSHNKGEAFIFSGNLCACIHFLPGTRNDYIIKGPITITAMFPFLRNTVVERGVDAAFESTKKYEAYLFKDDQYVVINYASDSAQLINPQRSITDGFHSLRGTIFASGIEAAFASHRTNQAYLFKGDSYALINFAPNDYIINGVQKILPNWPSLQPILPRRNSGLDFHTHTGPVKVRDQDEL